MEEPAQLGQLVQYYTGIEMYYANTSHSRFHRFSGICSSKRHNNHLAKMSWNTAVHGASEATAPWVSSTWEV